MHGLNWRYYLWEWAAMCGHPLILPRQSALAMNRMEYTPRVHFGAFFQADFTKIRMWLAMRKVLSEVV